MNVYFLEPGSKKKSKDLLEALKSVIGGSLHALQRTPVFSMDDEERGGQFFLKNGSGIVWGRVLYEPLKAADLKTLEDESRLLAGVFGEPIRPYIFFPACETELPPGLSQARFYQYYWLESLEGEALALRPCAPAAGPAAPNVLPEKRLPVSDGTPFTPVRLSRRELSALIDLSAALSAHSG